MEPFQVSLVLLLHGDHLLLHRLVYGLQTLQLLLKLLNLPLFLPQALLKSFLLLLIELLLEKQLSARLSFRLLQLLQLSLLELEFVLQLLQLR